MKSVTNGGVINIAHQIPHIHVLRIIPLTSSHIRSRSLFGISAKIPSEKSFPT